MLSTGRCCRVRLVLFDLDGTIIDTMQLYAEKASRLLEEHAGIPREEAVRLYLSTAGRPFREQLRLMGIKGGVAGRVARLFEKEKERILESSTPHERVWRRLHILKRSGLTLALSTNNECRLVERLKWARRLFDIVLCHDPERGTGKGRPHLEELEAMGFRVCEVVFVGDSEYDMKVYEPLGVRSVRTTGLWKSSDRAVAEVLRLAGEEYCPDNS